MIKCFFGVTVVLDDCFSITSLLPSLPSSLGCLTGKSHSSHRSCTIHPNLCALVSHTVQAMVWLPMVGILNMHADDVCCANTKTVCTASCLQEKSFATLGDQGIKPTSVLFQSHALPTELSHFFTVSTN